MARGAPHDTGRAPSGLFTYGKRMRIGLGPLSASAASGPSNDVAPALSGTPKEGQTLTTTNGAWTGVGTITYARKWYVSADGVSGWTAIPGQTGLTYAPVDIYVDAYLRTGVVATDDNGPAAEVFSNVVGPILEAGPEISVAPVVTGTVEEDSDLTTTNGTWTGTGTQSYARKWYRSDDGVTGWSQIAAQTGLTYTQTAADIAKYIRSGVVATDDNGASVEEFSNVVGPVAALPVPVPVNSVAPVLSGYIERGATVTCSTGTWSNSPSSYNYQWYVGASPVGTNQNTYVPLVANIGSTLRCEVTAVNAGGPSAPATTATSAAIKGGQGLDWTDSTITSYQWQFVRAGNGALIAGNSNSPDLNTRMANSTNGGVSWTVRGLPVLSRCYDAVYAPALGMWLAVGGTTTAYVFSSANNGVSWTARLSAAAGGGLRSIDYNGSLAVAVGQDCCHTSVNGTTWTPQTMPAGAWWRVVWHAASGLWVAMGTGAGGLNQIATSPTGAVWTLRTSLATTGMWYSMATDGNIIVCVALNGGTTDTIMTSTDAISWAYRTVPAVRSPRDVCWTGRKFLAIGSSGTNRVYHSDDGLVWTLPTTIPATVLAGYGITYDTVSARVVIISASGSPQVQMSP